MSGWGAITATGSSADELHAALTESKAAWLKSANAMRDKDDPIDEHVEPEIDAGIAAAVAAVEAGGYESDSIHVTLVGHDVPPNEAAGTPGGDTLSIAITFDPIAVEAL